MYKHQADVSGFPYFAQVTKQASGISYLRKEKKSLTHVWNPNDNHPTLSSNYCLFCYVEFSGLIQWHAHMASYIHKSPLLPESQVMQQNKEQLILCKICKQEVLILTVNSHRCFLNEVTKLQEIIDNFNNSYCPLICILCKKVKVFSSQAALQIHIVTRHSPLKHPRRCSLCNAQFRTTDVSVHEAHAVDVHGPELNLLYYRFTEHTSNKKQKEGMRYTCALFYYSHTQHKDILSNCENINDLFELTTHTLCYHGFVPLKKFTEHFQKEEISVVSSYRSIMKIDCKYCGFQAGSILHLNDHILQNHTLELLLRKDFIQKKKLFVGKIPLSLTCFYCVTLYTSVSELQIHLMVRHSNPDFGLCGMCDKNLIFLPENENPNRVSKMHWRAIQYHEKCHLRQFNYYKVHGIFNRNLSPNPILYQSYKDFIEEIDKSKNFKSDILFTDEQIAFFKVLHQNNYESQIDMEMLAN